MKLLQKVLPWVKPSPVPSSLDEDDVYPLHMLDDTKGCREYFLAWTLRFNDVLDGQHLNDSLCRLLEIGDWKKLGGRLGFNANGRLVIHVPKQFTKTRPAVTFSWDTSSSQLSIEEHPLARDLPKGMDEPSLRPGAMRFRTFSASQNVPTSIEDAISRDAPQLSLHVTSFNDATLVGISFPHTLMDAVGFQSLLRSWSLVLAGHEDEVPPILGATTDALWAAAGEKIEPSGGEGFVLGRKLLHGVAFLKFVVRLAWDMFRDPVVESQILHLPTTAISELRRQAMDSIANISSSGPNDNTFVSEGDILMAWIAQTIASAEPQRRPVAILRAINARFRLASFFQTPAKGVYMQNMVLASFARLSPQLARGPLGPIALESRRQLAEQTTTRQMKFLLQLLRHKIERGQEPTVISADPKSVAIVFNDLTKINLIGAVDFAPAVVQRGDATQDRRTLAGKMVYHHFHSLKQTAWRRNWFVVLGKDNKGGTWIMVALTRKSSSAFRGALKKLSRPEVGCQRPDTDS